jgi:acyl carrier protein
MADIEQYTTAQIKSNVKEYIIKEFMYDDNIVDLDDDFLLMENGIVDSLKVLRLIIFLEKQFNFTIKPEEMIIDHFETIDTIADLVQGRLKKEV